MEKKNNKILIGLIGVLLIFVVVLIGYIVTNSFKDNKCDNIEEISNNNQDINISNDFYSNILKNRKELKQIQTFSKFNILGVVDLDGNVYLKLKEGMTLNKDSTKDFGTYGTYEIDGYYDSEGPDGSNVIEGYKLNIKNVVAVYETESGNGGNRYIIFLKSDGTIGTILTTPSSEEVYIKYTETIQEVKNIVTIITDTTDGNTLSPFLIDKDGNIYPFWKVNL